MFAIKTGQFITKLLSKEVFGVWIASRSLANNIHNKYLEEWIPLVQGSFCCWSIGISASFDLAASKASSVFEILPIS
jgi:hypothetical protein